MSRNNELIYFTYLAEYVKQNGVPEWRLGQDSPEDVFRNLCRVDPLKLLEHIFQQLAVDVPGRIDRSKAKEAMKQVAKASNWNLDSFRAQAFTDPNEEAKYVSLVTSSVASAQMKSACLSVASMDTKAIESASEEKEDSDSQAVTAAAAAAKASQLKAAAPWESKNAPVPEQSAAPAINNAPVPEQSASNNAPELEQSAAPVSKNAHMTPFDA